MSFLTLTGTSLADNGKVSQLVQNTGPSSADNGKVAQFVQKLYKIVDDSATNDVICWSTSGNSLIILDHDKLAKEQLGAWFKHNNFTSFVRQLNMYGFHKVPQLQQGVMRPSDSASEVYEFTHDLFRRGHPELLSGIKKKAGVKEKSHQQPSLIPAISEAQLPPIDMHSVVLGLAAIRRHQNTISSELEELKQSNQALWKEAMESRLRHQKQEDTINRIVKFLAGAFGNQVNSVSQDGFSSLVPVPKSRLMIEAAKRDTEKAGVDDLPFLRDTSPFSNRFSTVETPVASSEQGSLPSTPWNVASPQPADSVTTPAPTDNVDDDLVLNSNSGFVPPSPTAEAKMQAALSQFTPAELQQFMASLLSKPATGESSGSQISPFQSSFDFGCLSPPPLSLPPPSLNAGFPSSTQLADPNGLISFDPQYQLSNEWEGAEDIGKEVDSVNESINSLMDTFGIDSNFLDNLPMNSDDFFNDYLRTFPQSPAVDSVTNTFLDDAPIAQPVSTVEPPPMLDSESTLGRKRKSEGGIPSQTEETTTSPKRRKER
ncbi:hypothetical protein C8J56DRAFT_836719 [Mycena floridula]|nr:hypothetical protein C8J56DRAFT_836719 [Mycena floridula]